MTNTKPVRWLPEAARQFADPVMVADYRQRDPYHPQAIDMMRALAANNQILDVGCGCGHLTYLLSRLGSVTGIDPSVPMLALAKGGQPSKTKKRIQWVNGTVEDNRDLLPGGYGIVTAADSIHWTDWPRFFPTVKELIVPNAYLVIVERFKGPAIWRKAEKTLVKRFYTEKDQGRYDPVDEIASRGYFRLDGTHVCPPIMVAKTTVQYIAERHSRNGCSRSRMGDTNAAVFDAKLASILTPYEGPDGLLRYEAYTKLRWGVLL